MREFTIRSANRPGVLASLTESISFAGVNIEALAGFGLDGEGLVHLIVDDEPTARAVLQRDGIRFTEREVISTVLPHEPGSLASATRELADAGVNIDAVYLLRSTVQGLEFALAVSDLEPARSRLAG
jgi:hypothetical protein